MSHVHRFVLFYVCQHLFYLVDFLYVFVYLFYVLNLLYLYTLPNFFHNVSNEITHIIIMGGQRGHLSYLNSSFN